MRCRAGRTGARWLLAAVGCLALASGGCATRLAAPEVSEAAIHEERDKQFAIALRARLERAARLGDVAHRVATAGAELCGDHAHADFGLLWVHSDALSDEYQDVRERVGLFSGLTVVAIYPDSPAADAGVLPGEEVARIGEVAPDSPKAVRKALEAARRSGTLRLTLRAPDRVKTREVSIHGVPACEYPVLLAEEDHVNAYADGKRVVVFKGMLRFADDDELALVIGHEIAHNSLGHVSEQRVVSGLGVGVGVILDVAAAVVGVGTAGAFTQIGGALAARVNSEDFERDADYMGVYIAARADYDVSGAANFWRRMAAEHPGAIKRTMLATHPSSPERSAALEAAVAEITRKREAGEPLRPEHE